MRIQHRPVVRAVRDGGDVVDAAYEREVQAAVGRAERRWANAQRGHAKAVARLDRAIAEHAEAALVAQIRAEVDLRWQELRALEVEMQQSPGGRGVRWSGRGSVRNPLPKGSKL